jgi:hypothetical protein
MYLKEFTIQTAHKRTSKNGKIHQYFRNTTVIILRCDNCCQEFQRLRGKMDPKRLSNNYFHVCDNCDAKRFAQSRGAKKKTIWKLKASSDIPISKL